MTGGPEQNGLLLQPRAGFPTFQNVFDDAARLSASSRTVTSRGFTETGTGELADRLKGIAAFALVSTLRRGSSGPAVEALQRALAQLGHSSGPADGRFGPATDQAERAFQSRSGLAADGVVGTRTKAAIADTTDSCATLSHAADPAGADLSAWAAAAAIATSPQRRPRLPQKLPSDILTLQSKGHLNLVATMQRQLTNSGTVMQIATAVTPGR
jgi:peptidoglycan hydrolase-like protein with peptidoglycan-binding domain